MHSKQKYLTTRFTHWLALLGGMGLCLSALGQDEEQLQTGQPAARQLPFRYAVDSSYQFNAPVDGGGNFSLWRLRAALSIPAPLGQRLALYTTVRYELDSYDFGGGLDPWRDIHTLSASPLLFYRPAQHWLVYGGPILRVAAESNARWDEAIQGGGLVAATYIVNPRLSFGAGIAGMTQIAKDPRVLPILTAKWNFATDWKLTAGFTDLATTGYGIEVAWDCCPHWNLALGGQFHDARFRIAGSGATANGVGEEQSFVLGTALTWKPERWFSASAFAALAAGGTLRIDASNGTQLQSSKYDPTAILGLKAGVRF